ncbi:MAG TPA: ScpA family protein [Candidatus Limnocylindria bacterium]|nr:ScpA family protein [Candidatus Limnocylindria bacterium]
MPLQPIAVETAELSPVEVGETAFEVRLPVFAGPLQLLLHLIESRQLDVLTVPLAEVADAYVEHLARHPVDVSGLSEFVAIAAQLILIKSRRLLPGEQATSAAEEAEEAGEEELRRRLVEYRALRDAARALGERDLTAPLMRREPRETDLPRVASPPLHAAWLVEALDRLAHLAEPEPPPPEVVAREVTIGMQIRALLDALSTDGRVILQAVLATCRSRTEAAVTVLAALELVRRRQVRVRQSTVFGPILIEVAARPSATGRVGESGEGG